MFKYTGSSLLLTFQKAFSRGKGSKSYKNPAAQFYIRGIPTDIEPHKVKELFSRKVPIHFCNVPKDSTGKHMGFCFVTLNQDQIDWFIKVVDKMVIDGKKLVVSPANGRVTIPIGRRNPG
ncbi:hypothetical protein DSO57_1036835 [Entomophthora muscae]|uniref:Uncharacterized protein n=1 Tax=Entomophthora muscae TaxID=34485 RepID=A0ACC2SBU9_9FUNG|nr:hypothetical protein DSO57_1036835 [Entomophthora muscae]